MPPQTPTRPPRRPSCRKRHRRPSSAMRSRASAPPTPPKPSANGSRPPTPRPRPSAPPPPPPPPPHREGEGHGQGEGKGQQGTLRQGATEGKAPIGTGHQKRHNQGAGNHPRTGKGQERGPRHRGRGHPGRRRDPHPGKGIPRLRDQRRPTPSERPMTPEDAHPQRAPPKQEWDAVRITPTHTHQPPETTGGMEGTPTRGERAIPTEEVAGNTAARRTTTPSPPGDDPGRHKGHLTGGGRGQRHGHRNQGY